MNVEQLLIDLNSGKYSLQKKAQEKLLEVQSSKTINELSLLILKREFQRHTPNFLDILDHLIVEESNKKVPFALKKLFEVYDNPNCAFKDQVEDIFERFCSAKDKSNHFKSYSIKEVWRFLKLPGRLLASKAILDRRIPFLVNDLAENFKFENRELNLVTLKCFQVLKSAQANQYLIQFINLDFINNPDDEIFVKIALSTLGDTGYFWHGKRIKKMIENQTNIEILKVAISSYRRLFNDQAIDYFVNYYRFFSNSLGVTKSEEIKRHILLELSDINSRNSFFAILDLYAIEKSFDQRIEMIRCLLRFRLKDETEYLKDYIKSHGTELIEGLSPVIEKFSGEEIDAFLIKTFRKTVKLSERVSIIRLLSNLGTKKTKEFIYSIIRDSGQLLSYHAYHNLLRFWLKQKLFEQNDFFEFSLLSKDHFFTSLNFINRNGLPPKAADDVSNFFIDHCKSIDKETYLAALEVLYKIPSKNGFYFLLSETENDLSDFVSSVVLRSIRKSISRFPSLYSHDDLKLLTFDQWFYMNLRFFPSKLLVPFLLLDISDKIIQQMDELERKHLEESIFESFMSGNLELSEKLLVLDAVYKYQIYISEEVIREFIVSDYYYLEDKKSKQSVINLILDRKFVSLADFVFKQISVFEQLNKDKFSDYCNHYISEGL